ncbi:MAG: T9SS type A sorting domain-containing protein [Flavobacteriales bacterium]|nr:MAG: T9SS type A sorting domain-containing protein [Flavobacteriales bacterium]
MKATKTSSLGFVSTLLCSVLAMRTDAQINIPFPDSGAMWVQAYEYMILPPPWPVFEVQSTSNFCMDGSDTLHNGESYSVIEHCSGGYIGGIRQDSGAVFFLPADSTQEFLLYDFGVAVGDTITDIYVDQGLCTGDPGFGPPHLKTAVVNQMDTEPDYPYRRRIYLDAIGFGDVSVWLEGVGSGSGLFSYSASNVSNFNHYLYCMSHMDTTWVHYAWPGVTAGTCTPWYMGLENASTAKPRLAWPNPTDGIVSIVLSSPRTESVRVVDAIGGVVPVPISQAHRNLVVDLSDLPSGPYVVQCGTTAHRIIKQ